MERTLNAQRRRWQEPAAPAVFPLPNRSTRAISCTGLLGNTLATRQELYDGSGWTPIGWEVTRYDADGRVIATWGATYPVAYEYDSFGRMAAMATTRDPSLAVTNLLTLLPAGVMLSDVSDPSYPSDKLDTTRWLYHEATGLLTNKLYSDGKGPAYTYTPDGTVLSRTQDSLGRSTGIAASPAYAVSYAYDSLGRFASVTSVLSVVNYSYAPGTDLLAGWTTGPLTVSRSCEPHRDLLTQVRTMAGTNMVSHN